MGEMLTYIFSSLRSSEKRLDVVTRAVSKQRSFNKQLTIFAVMTTANFVTREISKQRGFNKQITIFAALTTANLIVMKIEQKDQALRIRKLEKEIEELKRPEGE